MRSTLGRVTWLMSKKGKVIGISLGADATTEHSMGTDVLAEKFGYSFEPEDGFEGRLIKKLPPRFGVKELQVDGEPCLLLSSSLESAEFYRARELHFPVHLLEEQHAADTCAAWDQRNFAILARRKDIKYLAELASRFEALDVMAGGFLESHYDIYGLTYAVMSQVPHHVKAAALAANASALVKKNGLSGSTCGNEHG